MWTIVAEAVSSAQDAPPQVPGELIGILLTSLITGATAIAVALIQRGKKDSRAAALTFTVPESEWITVRDRSLTNENTLAMLDRTMTGHIRHTDEEHDRLREDIANIKGQLGIK